MKIWSEAALVLRGLSPSPVELSFGYGWTEVKSSLELSWTKLWHLVPLGLLVAEALRLSLPFLPLGCCILPFSPPPSPCSVFLHGQKYTCPQAPRR